MPESQPIKIKFQFSGVGLKSVFHVIEPKARYHWFLLFVHLLESNSNRTGSRGSWN